MSMVLEHQPETQSYQSSDAPFTAPRTHPKVVSSTIQDRTRSQNHYSSSDHRRAAVARRAGVSHDGFPSCENGGVNEAPRRAIAYRRHPVGHRRAGLGTGRRDRRCRRERRCPPDHRPARGPALEALDAGNADTLVVAEGFDLSTDSGELTAGRLQVVPQQRRPEPAAGGDSERFGSPVHDRGPGGMLASVAGVR